MRGGHGRLQDFGKGGPGICHASRSCYKFHNIDYVPNKHLTSEWVINVLLVVSM